MRCVLPVLISIHALLAESDVTGLGRLARPGLFLSTLSLRRATNTGQPVRGLPSHFYPRSPCGERPPDNTDNATGKQISIHALLAESDGILLTLIIGFLEISIHALLAESDHAPSRRLCPRSNFYPRSPCGERQTMPSIRHISQTNFYPRSPCGERPAAGRFLLS